MLASLLHLNTIKMHHSRLYYATENVQYKRILVTAKVTQLRTGQYCYKINKTIGLRN